MVLTSKDVLNRVRSLLHEKVPPFEQLNLISTAVGTSTTLICNNITMDPAYAKYAVCEFVTGTNAKAIVDVVNYDPGTFTLTFKNPLGFATTISDVFNLSSGLFYADQEIIDASGYAANDVYNSLPKDKLTEVLKRDTQSIALTNFVADVTLPADRSGGDLVFFINEYPAIWTSRHRVLNDTSCDSGVALKDKDTAVICSRSFTSPVEVQIQYIPNPDELVLGGTVDWIDSVVNAIIIKTFQILLLKRERTGLSSLSGAMSKNISGRKRE